MYGLFLKICYLYFKTVIFTFGYAKALLKNTNRDARTKIKYQFDCC